MARKGLHVLVLIGALATRAISQDVPPRPRIDFEPTLREWSRYAGWGAAVGAAAGFVYGITTVRAGPAHDFKVLGDFAIGGGVGLIAGSVVYLIKAVSSQRHSAAAPFATHKANPLNCSLLSRRHPITSGPSDRSAANLLKPSGARSKFDAPPHPW